MIGCRMGLGLNYFINYELCLKSWHEFYLDPVSIISNRSELIEINESIG